MKRILLFILPILAIIAAGLAVLGIVQVRSVRENLMDDLARKARTVAESIAFSAREILRDNDVAEADRLVDSFQLREQLQGCILYDREINVVAVTERIAQWKQPNSAQLKLVVETRAARGDLERFGKYQVYRYAQPVFDENDNPLGLVEIVYDTSYLYGTLAELWRRISFALIGLVFLVVLVSFIVERQTYILPVRRLTSWFRRFQKGEADKLSPFGAKGELGKLVSEIEQVALSLRVARRAVSDEAHARLQQEDIWTEAKLRDLVNAKLRESSLVVVSNREPFVHTIDEAGGVACMRPASGVVTAIDPIMRACGGTWVSHGSGNADRRFVNSKNKLGVPPGDDRYILKRVWLTKEEEEGYYYGFSNEGLWPLCHITHTRPIFRESDWRTYEKVNRMFAERVLEELPARDPFVFIQDYHFTLLPRMIKEKRPDATIALFWHIPWPNPESFAICPYQHEILEGMLGCDLIGFHVQFHCNNFLETVNRLMEARVDMEKFSVVRGEKETFIHAFPISIDGYFGDKAPAPDVRTAERIRAEHRLEGKIVAIGVDRIDYTKGIIERILAIDRFLEKYPEYRKRFVFIQIGAPSRTHIKQYHDFAAEVDELIQKKNWKYSDDTWQPIIYLNRNLPPEEVRAYYEVGDLCIVSSLHDGMNLVAKEYVASKRGAEAALILSRFTGAARELTDAVLINPYSVEEFADAIKRAIEMPAAEKRRRMENMHKVVAENNVYRWAANIVTELTAMNKSAIPPE